MAMSRFERFGEISDASAFPLRFGQIDNEDQSGEGLGTGGPVLRVANMEFFHPTTGDEKLAEAERSREDAQQAAEKLADTWVTNSTSNVKLVTGGKNAEKTI